MHGLLSRKGNRRYLLNRGCVPTKTLLHVSEIFHEAGKRASSGIRIDGARMDTEALFAYKREICDKLRSGSESQLKAQA